jgi:hypothetical protein
MANHGYIAMCKENDESMMMMMMMMITNKVMKNGKLG